MQGSDAVVSAQAPILVPLAPRAGITTVTGIAPPAPIPKMAPQVIRFTLDILSVNRLPPL
jgi:hypothetical protein